MLCHSASAESRTFTLILHIESKFVPPYITITGLVENSEIVVAKTCGNTTVSPPRTCGNILTTSPGLVENREIVVARTCGNIGLWNLDSVCGNIN